ncbi:MAG TPA: hypothetical protein VHB98_00235 [Chloroflexota bacterium]|jgi:hypothetical protein|nr:hypothetical protein [Chloroflexota bacterium]
MSLRNTLLSTVLLVGGTVGVAGLRPPAHAAPVGRISAAHVAPMAGIPRAAVSLLPPSRYRVSPDLVTDYCGRYSLQSVDRRTRLTSGTIEIVRRTTGSLLGLATFYGVDQRGFHLSWIAMLSDFHAMAQGRLRIELYNQVGQDLHASLVVSRNAAGDLGGQLTLAGQAYAIGWHRMSAP